MHCSCGAIPDFSSYYRDQARPVLSDNFRMEEAVSGHLLNTEECPREAYPGEYVRPHLKAFKSDFPW